MQPPQAVHLSVFAGPVRSSMPHGSMGLMRCRSSWYIVDGKHDAAAFVPRSTGSTTTNCLLGDRAVSAGQLKLWRCSCLLLGCAALTSLTLLLCFAMLQRGSLCSYVACSRTCPSWAGLGVAWAS